MLLPKEGVNDDGFPCSHHRSGSMESHSMNTAAPSQMICKLLCQSYCKKGNDSISLLPSFGESEPAGIPANVCKAVKAFTSWITYHMETPKGVIVKGGER